MMKIDVRKMSEYSRCPCPVDPSQREEGVVPDTKYNRQDVMVSGSSSGSPCTKRQCASVLKRDSRQIGR